MYPTKLINNLLNPSSVERIQAFEYWLALCCCDGEEGCEVVKIDGNVVATADGVFQYVVTEVEAQTLFTSTRLQNEPSFVFGSDIGGNAVNWYVFPL
jgi:hypothetical protein